MFEDGFLRLKQHYADDNVHIAVMNGIGKTNNS